MIIKELLKELFPNIEINAVPVFYTMKSIIPPIDYTYSLKNIITIQNKTTLLKNPLIVLKLTRDGYCIILYENKYIKNYEIIINE